MNVKVIRDIHDKIARNLGYNCNKQLTETEAGQIIDKLFILVKPPKLILKKEDKIVTHNWLNRLFYKERKFGVAAEACTSKNTITVYGNHLTVSILLHECAHMNSDAFFHYKKWQECFKRLVEWYNQQ